MGAWPALTAASPAGRRVSRWGAGAQVCVRLLPKSDLAGRNAADEGLHTQGGPTQGRRVYETVRHISRNAAARAHQPGHGTTVPDAGRRALPCVRTRLYRCCQRFVAGFLGGYSGQAVVDRGRRSPDGVRLPAGPTGLGGDGRPEAATPRGLLAAGWTPRQPPTPSGPAPPPCGGVSLTPGVPRRAGVQLAPSTDRAGHRTKRARLRGPETADGRPGVAGGATAGLSEACKAAPPHVVLWGRSEGGLGHGRVCRVSARSRGVGGSLTGRWGRGPGAARSRRVSVRGTRTWAWPARGPRRVSARAPRAPGKVPPHGRLPGTDGRAAG